MLRKLVHATRHHDWFTVFVEIVVVVVGIFLALQADSWNDHRQERVKEQEYLERIQRAVTNDLESWEFCLTLASLRRDYGQLILESVRNPEIVEKDPSGYFMAVRTAGWTSGGVADAVAFDELKFGGELGIIRNVDVRQALAEYYNDASTRQQYDPIRLETSSRYHQAVERLLKPDEEYRMVAAERPMVPDLGNPHFSVEEALQLRERISQDKNYLASVTFMTSQRLPTFNCTASKGRAENVLKILDRELSKGARSP